MVPVDVKPNVYLPLRAIRTVFTSLCGLYVRKEAELGRHSVFGCQIASVLLPVLAGKTARVAWP